MVSIFQSALFFAFLIVLCTSVIISSLFQFKSLVQFLLSIYLLTFANIVITSEFASIFNLLNNRFFFLGMHCSFLLVSFLLWKARGKPPLFSPVIRLWRELRTTKLFNLLKNHPFLFLLGLGVFIAYGIGLLLVLKVAPNNYDGLVAYMARVGYWFQHGNFKPWPTWNIGQTQNPINAQIQIFWTILFWRTDTFAGIVQWFAAIFCFIAIYGISRQLSKTRPQALFASFVFALFPIIILESTSVQSHLSGATLLLISFYFLFAGYQNSSKSDLIFTGLAFGLSLGVHGIMIFAIPGFFVAIIFMAIKKKSIIFEFLKPIIISLLLSFLLFSSFIYVQNTIYTHYPLGDNQINNNWSPLYDSNVIQQESYWLPKNVLKYTFYNICRYSFASYDLTGIPEAISNPFYKLRDLIYIPLFETTKNPLQHEQFDIFVHMPAVSENWAWFGLVGYFLFYPLIIYESVVAIKRKEPIRCILILNIIIYTLVWAGLLAREDGWHMYSSRYFIPAGVLFAPLISSVYGKRLFNKILVPIIVISSLFISFFTIRDNYSKPLYSDGAILKWTRLEQLYQVGWEQYPVILSVENTIPKKARLGLLLQNNTIEYPFLGQYFERTLITILPYSKIMDEEWIKKNDIEWILSCIDSVEKPDDFSTISYTPFTSPLGQNSSGCTIYKRIE